MSFNVPGYTTGNFSIGPGILYLGPLGAEPTIDVGAVRSGMTISIAREKVDIYQGIPRSLVETYTVQETGTVSFQGLEWNLDRLQDSMGAGSVTSTANTRTFQFGGQITFDKLALKFVHTKPDDKTITVSCYSVRGAGDITLTFGDDPHEIPFVFDMLLSSTDWASQALPIGTQLFKIEQQL
jgi:hypothetical protein